MEKSRVEHVVNPPVPETPEGQYALLIATLRAANSGGKVSGVTKEHITSQGMEILDRALGGVATSASRPQLWI